jgi:hypothetical protein
MVVFLIVASVDVVAVSTSYNLNSSDTSFFHGPVSGHSIVVIAAVISVDVYELLSLC